MPSQELRPTGRRIEGTVDEPHVGVGLRETSPQSVRARVEVFEKEPERGQRLK